MRYFIVFLCGSLLSLSCLATTQPPERKHTLGAGLGGGWGNISESLGGDWPLAHLGVFYEYQLNAPYALHFAAIAGSGSCFLSCSDSAEELSYSSYQISLKAATQFSGRWNLFARGGLGAYQLKYHPSDSIYSTSAQEPKTISGVKPLVAVGAQFRAKSGLSFHVEYAYLAISGGDLGTVNTFIGYAF